ncbi:putative disease resistance protein RGA4 isoform X1 [Elaeis guineensis]|uniref:Disease resistance protein RGA2 isoform X1 n=1 Tax=Elaeis guineensis var. tenera TaxID=51953 RepID=A0A6I9SEY9_ELAGV|nr:disease resistance protein RGA2 isoform X1 [Elaeis guineensis]XP_029116287.1 disease resistance protein RGA2 isoform X1 [Elaeis guineensis]
MSLIAEAFVSKLFDGLVALVKDEVARLLGVTDEITRLQETLQTIKAILTDAERKKIQGEAINNWLKKLKDVMYDADDILDECRIEARKSEVAASFGPQPSSYFSVGMPVFKKMRFTHKIDSRIQKLNHRLEDILAEKSKFDFQLSSAGGDDHQSTSQVSRMTSSVPEPDIVGSNIEKDTDKLVELLMKEDTRENILAYAIVGIGGIGKTTFARRIFYDERIKANFPMRLWVCVSKDFEETSLLKEIITQAKQDPRDTSSRAQLEPMVREVVKNKKFLLVLDDLWESEVWNDLLRIPLQSGATGSRVLVTTRKENVALQMKAVSPHHKVELLSAEDGWVLLRKKAVLSGEEREIEDLKDIGKEIVDKCGGLPLAIKTIGGVLSSKSKNKKDWEKVLKTLSCNAWSSWTDFPEEVQPALYLSYEDLPSHLKQCFLYCSLFPEDHKFYRPKLIRYWISEGFIHEEGGLTLEELGEDYYGDLVQRSFLQPVHWCNDDSRCTVHDLLWSLARFLAGDENLHIKDGVELVLNSSSPVKRRRLWGSVPKEKRQTFIDALQGHDSLRTLLLEGSQVEENEFNDLIKKTPRLRVLDLFGCRIEKLPDSLGNLIHLRYLDLSGFFISELPESIGNLVNLQFLILESSLKLRSLPKGIGKLHNLRCLDLWRAELEGIPIEIANLHRLNRLINFVVRNNNSNSGWCTLEELRSLQKLRVLHIMHLERALNEGGVTEVYALRDMLQLEVLELHWQSPDDCGEEEIKRLEEIFEMTLCPPSPSRLESLKIDGFFGLHYPSWIASCTTDSLRRLDLSHCWICPELPPLGKLPNLEYLCIEGADAVKKIGTEFLGQEPDCSRDQGGRIQISFPKLTKLIFKDMDNWEEWEWEVKDDDTLIGFPNLEELTLVSCRKLRSLPSGLVYHATTLTKLVIYFCDNLKEIRGLSSVKELEISYSPNLDCVSDLPSLKTLILEVDETRFLSDWFRGGQPDFPALNELEIEASDQPLCGCLKDGLDWPKIEHIPYVYATSAFGGYISKTPSTFSTNLDDYVEDLNDSVEDEQTHAIRVPLRSAST